MTTVARSLEEVPTGPSALTLGVFDGVHRGHRELVARATDRAESSGCRSVAVTFDPHPASIVRPGSAPQLLQPLEERVWLLGAAGADLVLVLPFTLELSRLSPPEFVERVLVGPLEAEHVVVGSNYRFGHRAAGDVAALQELGATHGFSTGSVELLEDDGRTISSSNVRDALAAGDVAWAARALGRAWEHTGEVVRGDGRGRTIGFPTANVVAPPGLVRPGNGVYAARVRIDDEQGDADEGIDDDGDAGGDGGGTRDGAVHGGTSAIDAVVNVGTRPTFDGTTTTVEAHLLDTERDLYGARLRIAFVARIRDEQRFDGPEQLVAQIARDVEAGRELLDG